MLADAFAAAGVVQLRDDEERKGQGAMEREWEGVGEGEDDGSVWWPYGL